MRSKGKVFFSRLIKISAACFAESASPVQTFMESHYPETLGILPALALLMLLAFIVQIDPYIRRELKKTMRVIIAVVFSLVIQNYMDYRAAEGELPRLLRTLVSIYGYSVRPVIVLLFLRIIAPRKRFLWGWALAGINAAVYSTSLFSDVVFWIDMRNHYQGGPLSEVCLFISAFFLVYLFFITIRIFEPHKRKETWVPVIVLALIAGAVALDYNVGYIAQPIFDHRRDHKLYSLLHLAASAIRSGTRRSADGRPAGSADDQPDQAPLSL